MALLFYLNKNFIVTSLHRTSPNFFGYPPNRIRMPSIDNLYLTSQLLTVSVYRINSSFIRVLYFLQFLNRFHFHNSVIYQKHCRKYWKLVCLFVPTCFWKYPKNLFKDLVCICTSLSWLRVTLLTNDLRFGFF